ncbi:unnamed protein product [Schistosoma mattheei]|uniref:Uncharacterized protein n=1 Tax=Schistosoma mattheei TaxID=31246 RepID=A0A183PTC5_9TREM|nr:unnamed protein product [Schistosoma mattheei]
MGDLMKFVRQQFFDNNWTKSIDPDSLNEEKLECIDASFSHMDVKSKLCLLLAFSNMKQSTVQQVCNDRYQVSSPLSCLRLSRCTIFSFLYNACECFVY